MFATTTATAAAKSVVVSAVMFASFSAGASLPKHLDPSREAVRTRPPERSETACYTVYRTHRDAANRCPERTPTVRVYDFWNGSFRGWSCDCNAAVDDTST